MMHAVKIRGERSRLRAVKKRMTLDSVVRKMETIYLAAGLVAAVVFGGGCATQRGDRAAAVHAVDIDKSTGATHPIYEIDSKRAWGEHFAGRRIFVIDGQRFKRFPAFLSFVDGLPKGAILRWDSGCAMYEKIPLLDSTMTLKEFESYCGERGVTFRHTAGY